MKDIIEECHYFIGSKVIFNAVPIALAIMEDEGIGEKTVVQAIGGNRSGRRRSSSSYIMLIEFEAVLGLRITEAIGTTG